VHEEKEDRPPVTHLVGVHRKGGLEQTDQGRGGCRNRSEMRPVEEPAEDGQSGHGHGQAADEEQASWILDCVGGHSQEKDGRHMKWGSRRLAGKLQPTRAWGECLVEIEATDPGSEQEEQTCEPGRQENSVSEPDGAEYAGSVQGLSPRLVRGLASRSGQEVRAAHRPGPLAGARQAPGSWWTSRWR